MRVGSGEITRGGMGKEECAGQDTDGGWAEWGMTGRGLLRLGDHGIVGRKHLGR